MGVERAVTRWYVQRQLILTEIMDVAQKQELLAGNSGEQTQDAAVETVSVLQIQMEVAQKRLKALGHCPRPMMG